MIRLLDDAGDQVPFPPLVELEHLLALGIAQSLHDDLLGRLGGDTAEIARGVLPFLRHVAVLVEILSVDGDLTRVGIDGDPGFLGGSRGPLVGRDERVRERIEDGVGGHALLTLEQLQRIQQVVVHQIPSLRPGFGLFSHVKMVRAELTSS